MATSGVPQALALDVLLLLPIYVLVVGTNIFVGLLEFHLYKVAAGLELLIYVLFNVSVSEKL